LASGSLFNANTPKFRKLLTVWRVQKTDEEEKEDVTTLRQTARK
jgi:hypothetical protein